MNSTLGSVVPLAMFCLYLPFDHKELSRCSSIFCKGLFLKSFLWFLKVLWPGARSGAFNKGNATPSERQHANSSKDKVFVLCESWRQNVKSRKLQSELQKRAVLRYRIELERKNSKCHVLKKTNAPFNWIVSS